MVVVVVVVVVVIVVVRGGLLLELWNEILWTRIKNKTCKKKVPMQKVYRNRNEA